MCFTGIVGIADARIETYKKLTEIQPNDAKAFYELGNAHRSWIYPFITICEEFGNETRDEIKEMKQGIDPEIRDILDEAIKAYLKTVEINPEYTDAYNELAKVYHWRGNYREAIQAFKQAFVLVKLTNRENGTMTSYDSVAGAASHNLARAYHNLGKQNCVKGNYAEAIECYLDAILTCSWYHEVYYDLAVSNDEAGNYESAIPWYERVKYSYEYPDLRYRLAKAYHRLGRYQDAVEAYQKAIDRQIEIEDEYFRKSSYSLNYAEPLEYPEWWTEVNQNLESASRNEPL